MATRGSDRGCEQYPKTRHQGCAACLVAALLGTITSAGEVCRFAGTTDYSERIEVTSNINARVTDDTITVDVIVDFMATPWPPVG